MVWNDFKALVDDEEDHDKQENLDHVHVLEEKENYYYSLDTLIRSVWVGQVLVMNDPEALADDEKGP